MTSKQRLLFISSDFFDYRKAIQNKFESLNFEVDYIPNKPYYFSGLFNKIFKKYMVSLYKIYYMFKLYNKKNYDYIFIINGEFISSENLQLLLSNSKKAKSILYCWDSSIKNKNFKNIYTYFDVVYSFDKNDVYKFNINYKELFYINSNKQNKHTREYYFSFVGSYSKDRYNILKSIKNYALKYNYDFYFHLFITQVGFTREIKKYKNLDKDICRFKKISNTVVSDIIANTKVVIDLPTADQIGQTMRIFECIANNTKILTSNKSILNEKFYNKNMIRILNDNFSIDSSWLNNNGTYNNIEQYHIENWVNSFFE